MLFKNNKVFINGLVEEVSPDYLKKILLMRKTLFADLLDCGVEWLFFLKKNNFSPYTVTYYNNRIYVIYSVFGIIKCFKALGFKGGGFDFNIIENYLEKLDDFCGDQLNRSLTGYGLSSIAGISLTFFKKNIEYNFFLKNELKSKFILEQIFTGVRKKILTKIFGREFFAVDFNEAYTTILSEMLPVNMGEFEEGIWDFKQPAFVKVLVDQTGLCENEKFIFKKNTLIITADIEVVFLWYEELLFFKKCGGKILQIKGFVPVFDFKHIFRPAIQSVEFLSSKYKLDKKLMVNSFFGRLSMGPFSTTTHLDWNFSFFKYSESENFLNAIVYENLGIIECRAGKKNSETNLLVTAVVTARARIKLMELYFFVRGLGHTVMAYNTDAVLLKEEPSPEITKLFNVKIKKLQLEDFI